MPRRRRLRWRDLDGVGAAVTVAELIEKLKAMPQGDRIFLFFHGEKMRLIPFLKGHGDVSYLTTAPLSKAEVKEFER